MDELPEYVRQRFPNLGNLGIAVLEHLVEPVMGQAAIDAVKRPYAEKQIADALGEALTKAEADFKEQYADQDVRDALTGLPIQGLPDLPPALWAFYKNPNDHQFHDLLVRELKMVKGLSDAQVTKAVEAYWDLLKRQFVNVDSELQGKLNTLANMDSATYLRESTAYLREMRDLMRGAAQRPDPAPASQTSTAREAKPKKGSLPVGSYLPFSKNAIFTGREGDLKALEESLLGKKPTSALISQAIIGMGGIGKTQLAVEFAYQYGHKFKGAHWLDLREPDQLDAQIAQCGVEMALSEWPKEQPEQVRLTLHAWKQDGPRLLILDNLEDVGKGAEALKRLEHGNLRLLITSRHKDWPQTLGLRPLPLEVFTEQESIKFLRNYTKERFSAEELKGLAKRLGYLPLALELAGRYLEAHARMSVEQYIAGLAKAFEDESLRGFRKDLPNPTGHDLDLAATFAFSWKQIKNKKAQKFFLTAGYCAPNTPIPMEIFEQTLKLDGVMCDEALSALQGIGLLGEEAAIHPLLAEYARTLDRENTQLTKLAEELAEIAIACNHEVDQSGNYSLFTPLLPHVRAVAETAEAAKIADAGRLWNELGYHVRALADFVGAKAAYERALRIDEATFGAEHPNVAISVNNLGIVLSEQGDYAGAQAALERALRIDEAAFGAEHPNVARDINNLGEALRAQGDYAGAKAAYERAIRILEANLGAEHPQFATGVNNLGNVLQAQGDYTGAQAAYERALRIHEAAFGKEHPQVAIDVSNLGSVLQAQGDLSAAKAAYERALHIDEAAFGKEHPSVAIRVWWLGTILQVQGDLAGAKAAYERALRIYKKFLPEGHPNIKSVEGYLRSLEEEQGK